jgi:hypothetical protein
MSLYSDLLANPGAPRDVAILATPELSGSPVQLRWSTRVEGIRFTDDSPAREVWADRILKFPQSTTDLFSGGRVVTDASTRLSEIVLDNTDGSLDVYRTYSWTGQAFAQYWVGEDDPVAGTFWTLADAGVRRTGIFTTEPEFDIDARTVTLSVADNRHLLDAPLSIDRYHGIPWAIKLTGGNSCIAGTGNDLPASAFTLAAMIYPTNLAALSQRIIEKGNSQTTGFYVMASPIAGKEGYLQFRADALTPGTSVSASVALAEDTWQRVCVTYDGSTVRGFVDFAEVFSAGVTGTITTNTDNLEFGRSVEGWLMDVRMYPEALTAAQQRGRMSGPLDGSESDPVGAWIAGAAQDKTGATVTEDVIGSDDATLTGSPEWIPSLEAYPGDAGTNKPLPLGPVPHCEPAHVNVDRGIWQVGVRTVSAITTVWGDGGEIAFDQEYANL